MSNTASDVILYQREGSYIPRVAAVHDLCGYGKCSLGAAIPVLSAAGIDVCPLPTGLFSAHTKFPVFHMHDTTDMLEPYLDAWEAEGIEIDGVYSGFLSSAAQVNSIKRLYASFPGALRIVDPVMGDNGQIYPTYTPELCDTMKSLVDGADVLTPNLTEAAILSGVEYVDEHVSREFVEHTAEAILGLGAKYVVLKGVVHEGENVMRNYIAGTDIELESVEFELVPYMLHGTGDLYASALTAAIYTGRNLRDAVKFAGDFVRHAMLITPEQPDYVARGVSFEPLLGEVAALLA